MKYKSYVLINVMEGKITDVISELRQLEEVKAIDVVTGEYDIVATIVAEGLIDIGDLVVYRIKPLPYVFKVVTYFCINWPCERGELVTNKSGKEDESV